MSPREELIKELKQEIDNNQVVLFAKGTKEQPRCGFSAMTIQILNSYGIDFKVVDVLIDMEKKEALKELSEWPTIPQLYVNKEFVGGCDITRELHETGQLKAILEKV
ncbi:MAG: Grx4 family monothiol glutaredoxin [Candidatus Caenarcaniphilales bacterium]|nr:Grx4 family monothiol glutaredoxin [Candidatus Caenarcaniphilales bacterium]